MGLAPRSGEGSSSAVHGGSPAKLTSAPCVESRERLRAGSLGQRRWNDFLARSEVDQRADRERDHHRGDADTDRPGHRADDRQVSPSGDDDGGQAERDRHGDEGRRQPGAPGDQDRQQDDQGADRERTGGRDGHDQRRGPRLVELDVVLRFGMGGQGIVRAQLRRDRASQLRREPAAFVERGQLGELLRRRQAELPTLLRDQRVRGIPLDRRLGVLGAAHRDGARDHGRNRGDDDGLGGRHRRR